ncbi:MAG: pectinesterase family protein [Bacteroidia bacterium]|nr:pectinesterase family protein [Bacteroidia bacterium]
MKKITILLIALIGLSINVYGRTIIVDINGAGQFRSIQTAISNSSANDTIKVWPGTYVEQITLNKNIVLMGSGFENTKIVGTFDPTITMSSGKILWFQISSMSGNGILLSGKGTTVSNCVIRSCSGSGIVSNIDQSVSNVINCNILSNGGYGIWAYRGGCINVVNCIARWNSAGDYDGYDYGWGPLNLSYSNGGGSNTSGNQGCINLDPRFVSSEDLHISEGSPCWNTGQQSLTDPDGSRSDMGYFGGLDCPIYPVVYELIILKYGSNITLQAKGRANY